ncbi:MAG: MazG nucleotide pyrophosphohydrolase domain-containing protein [Phycisphaerae bacterium]|jgi:NTP pyrophosphatase (non-canonical NTP hydrolase)|nr:MazG nucleotide pyrophosphohydrolase domain-containing protein [Phycisphaerae bacterium]
MTDSPQGSPGRAGDVTIREFQDFILNQYGKRDSERGTPGTFMWFIEEVGELATALAGDDQANKEEEFADVLAWLNTLANINGVDLTAAVEKYTVRGVEGTK